jgi:SNF2 family DNA or RNA helicase
MSYAQSEQSVQEIDLISNGFKTEAKDHQLQTIHFMMARERSEECRGGMVLSTQGTGKTLSVLYSCVLNGGGTTLIICPAHIVRHWRDQLLDHTSVQNHQILIYHGAGRARHVTLQELPQFVITSYGVLAAEVEFLERTPFFSHDKSLMARGFHRIVFDEIHYLKNRRTRSFRASTALRGHVNWMLSGTHIMNRVDEAFSSLHLLQHPAAASWSGFNSRFCTRGIRGITDLQQAMQPLCIRHEKDVLDLPPQTVVQHELVLTGDEEAFYDTLLTYSRHRMKNLANRYVQQLRNGQTQGRLRTMSYILVLILRLRQAATDPALVCGAMSVVAASRVIDYFNRNRHVVELCPICEESDACSISRGCGHKFCASCWFRWLQTQTVCPSCRALTDESQIVPVTETDDMDVEDDVPRRSCKTNAVMQIIQHALQQDNSVVVCSQWTSYLEILISTFKEKFPQVEYCQLTGKDSTVKRHEIVHEFQSIPSIKVCFASLHSASEGVTLTKASTMIISDLYWNEAKTQQMADRIHRIGQLKATTVYKVIVQDTIETRICELIAKKKKICQIIAEGRPVSQDNGDWLGQIVRLLE